MCTNRPWKLQKFLPEALLIVGAIASDLAAEVESKALGLLSAYLTRLNIKLHDIEARGSTLSSDGKQAPRERLYKIFREIETACTWPETRNTSELTTLKSLTNGSEKTWSFFSWLQWFSAKTPHNRAQSCLKNYAANHERLEGLLIVLQEEIAYGVQESPVKTSISAPLSAEAEAFAAECPYPTWVNQELHDVLSKHMGFCFCQPQQCQPRLRLNARDHLEGNDAVCFELLFSTHTNPERDPATPVWKETKMLVMRRNPKRNQVAFSGIPSSTIGLISEQKSELVRPGSLCVKLNCPDNTISFFKIEDAELKRIDKEETLERKVDAAHSIPLSKAIATHRIPEKTQCILAYILAKSVWQYYESKWMGHPWTGDNVHLLHDQWVEQNSGSSLSSFRPYFVPVFQDGQNGISEYTEGEGIWHRYPKVLALGIILIEVAHGRPIGPPETPLKYVGDSSNYYLTSAWEVVRNVSLFNKDHGPYVPYSKVVKNCLNHQIFSNAPYVSGQQTKEEMLKSLKERRKMIYQQIVYPLEELMKDTAWLADAEIMEAPFTSGTTITPSDAPARPKQESIKQNHSSEGSANTAKSQVFGHIDHGSVAQSTQRSPVLHPTCSPPSFPAESCQEEVFFDGELESLDKTVFLGQNKTSSPEEWLKRFERISRFVKSNWRGRDRVKIAVLDTGCDLDASVFKVPEFREEVIKHWKDMVNGEARPIDEDQGKHGTRIVSVLLRIAPNAEIFVARVASNPKMLQKSYETIADAIIHSARNWNVDVVSMSFGFENEIIVIKNAIEEAHRIKNQSIVFLAAAGNDGYNSPELFPAFLDSVTSIRGIDHTGNFVASLNPRQHPFNKGESAYGTLGKDVPYAWPDEDACKTISGCSIATPVVAAAIVALILNCATVEVFNDNDRKLLRTQRAILGVFSQISESQDGRYYLAPWELFRKSDDEYRVSILRIAIRKLPAIA